MSAQCANCGFIFESNNEEVGQPCPRCGSGDRELQSNDEGKGRELAKEKRYDSSKKHEHGSYYDLVKGEKIGKDGKPVRVTRLIDREANLYIEVVLDNNGQIVTLKVEKLSEHGEG